MLTKQQIVNAVNEMPDEVVDLETLQEKLYLLQVLQKAEADITAGRTYSNEQMKQIIESWRQSPRQKLPEAS